MKDRKGVIEFAVVGAAASAVCIITPVADGFLGLIGLQSWIPSLRLVLLPLMALFVGLAIGTLYFRRRSKRRE